MGSASDLAELVSSTQDWLAVVRESRNKNVEDTARRAAGTSSNVKCALTAAPASPLSSSSSSLSSKISGTRIVLYEIHLKSNSLLVDRGSDYISAHCLFDSVEVCLTKRIVAPGHVATGRDVRCLVRIIIIGKPGKTNRKMVRCYVLFCDPF